MLHPVGAQIYRMLDPREQDAARMLPHAPTSTGCCQDAANKNQ